MLTSFINIVTSMYLVSLVTISVIANVWPYLNLGGGNLRNNLLGIEIESRTEQHELHLDEWIKLSGLFNLLLVMVVGTFDLLLAIDSLLHEF